MNVRFLASALARVEGDNSLSALTQGADVLETVHPPNGNDLPGTRRIQYPPRLVELKSVVNVTAAQL